MNRSSSTVRGVLSATGAFLIIGAATGCGSSDSSGASSGNGGDGSGGRGTGGRATSTGSGTSAGGRSTGGAGTGGAGGNGTGGGGAGSGGTGGAITSAGGSDTGSDGGATKDASTADVDGGVRDAGPLDARAPRTVLFADFEGPVPSNVDIGSGTLTPTQGFAPLGPPGNTFGNTFLRGPTGNTITITFSGLPPHTSLSVDFLFAAIDSLDGTGSFPAGDFFRIDLDGTQIFRESFANAELTQIQSYVPPPGVELARHVDLGFAGPGGYYTDSAYDLGADPIFDGIAHTASTAVLTFTLEGAGVQDINDESWAIDNLRVTTRNAP